MEREVVDLSNSFNPNKDLLLPLILSMVISKDLDF